MCWNFWKNIYKEGKNSSSTNEDNTNATVNSVNVVDTGANTTGTDTGPSVSASSTTGNTSSVYENQYPGEMNTITSNHGNDIK